MTIEVRQMLIRSTVGGEADAGASYERRLSADEIARLKEEVIAECREWLDEKLREARER